MFLFIEKLNLRIKRNLRNLFGQTATEYALIIGGVSLALYIAVRGGLVTQVRDKIIGLGGRVAGSLEDDKLGQGQQK